MIISFLMLILMSVHVWADNQYSIPTAVFEVDIQEDGSAAIHETWTVRFISGDFTRFYKDLSTEDLPADETFTSISDVTVLIDGRECEFTEDTDGRPEYHYNLSYDGPGATLSAYAKSSNVTRTYEFFYTLHDAVKCVDDSYNLFVYRFIGANFAKDVDAVEVSVTAPSQASCEVLYASKGETYVNGNTAGASCTNSSGMYKFRLRMDGADIPGAMQISSSDLSNTKHDDDGDNFSMIFAGIVSACWAIVLILVFGTSRKKKKIRMMLQDQGMLPIYQLISRFSSILDPTEFVEEVEQTGND